MADTPPALDRRPEARSETAEDLVRLVREGRVRIPTFQRGLKWEAQQVVDLFDSIYRGYPVGSLLISKRKAMAERIHIGPLLVDAPEIPDAWWVVDGQQRLTSLAASLARPEPIPRTPVDPFVVYFDPFQKTFRVPSRDGNVPDKWVPVPLLLDAARLSEWSTEWPYRSEREGLRALFEAGKRIREYKLPMYLLETEDNDLLKEIFFRVNNAGKPLVWHEVHDALYRHDGTSPSTTTQLAEALATFGMGRPSEDELTPLLLAIRGQDVTRPLAEHRRKNRDVLRGAVAEALPVLRQVLWFLRNHAAVPHLRLLPRMMVIEVLGRFFTKHPEPNKRTLELLTRWVWRALLGEGRFDERTLRRHGVAAVSDDEEGSVQALLKLVPAEPVPLSIDARFDARSARTRLALLALASLEPRSFVDGREIDIAHLVEEQDLEAFRVIVRVSPTLRETRSPANRLIHPGEGSVLRQILEHIRATSRKDTILASHAISEDAAQALVDNNSATFLAERERMIREALARLGNRLAGWSRRDRDRPSIAYLLERGTAPND